MKDETRQSRGTKHEGMKKNNQSCSQIIKAVCQTRTFPGGQKAIVPFSTTSTALLFNIDTR